MSLLSETALPTDSAAFTTDELNEGHEPAKKRVSLHTLGCRLNQSETGVIARSFEQQGYAVVPDFRLIRLQ